VIDFSGRLAAIGRAYDRVNRGGIANIRLAQYRNDVVRVVLDLDRQREYKVTKDKDGIRISVTTDGQFAAWHSSGAMLARYEGAPAKQAAPDNRWSPPGSSIRRPHPSRAANPMMM
jgi:hypothetical protein